MAYDAKFQDNGNTNSFYNIWRCTIFAKTFQLFKVIKKEWKKIDVLLFLLLTLNRFYTLFCDLVLMSLLSTLNLFNPFYSGSIIDYERVNVCGIFVKTV